MQLTRTIKLTIYLLAVILLSATGTATADQNQHQLASPFFQDQAGYTAAESGVDSESALEMFIAASPIDVNTALIAGADYLKHAQADVTEDNAGNGNPDVPDDPDDGGWDWILTAPNFTHSTGASPTNIYGATAMGLYYAYLDTSDATYLTAMSDAANAMIADPDIDSASDLVFLMRYQDLSGVTPGIYQDAARTKFDAKILSYGSAAGLAEYIRDGRAGQGYQNGIIPWDIGTWAVAAQMLSPRYPPFTAVYAQMADDIAEVIYQDSYEQNPGYFDLTTNKNNGWDPTYSNYDYYWYSLGITGLIDAFESAGVHTDKIAGLVTILLECQYASGAFSFSYGANTDDEDWQSAGYAVTSLARVDQPANQGSINYACYWLGATQDTSGGWVYSGSGNHYPEIGGEATAALYFGQNLFSGEPPEVWVDDDYDTSWSDGHLWGYDAFDNIPEGIDAVAAGGIVHVEPGSYVEAAQIIIDKNLTLDGNVSDRPVVSAGFNTGTSGDARGWFLVQPDIELHVDDIIFDGTGSLVYQAFRHMGTGSFTNCVFSEIKYQESGSPYSGLAIAAFGGPGNPINVTGCVFEEIGRVGILYFGSGLSGSVYDNNVYTGKGDGDWLDYALDISAGAVITVQNSTITNCKGVADSDGSTSAGVLVSTYYGAGTEAHINNNIITGNTTGIASGYDGSDTSLTVFHHNDLSGNVYGVQNTSATVVVDASANWWGDNTPAGIPVLIDGTADYTPWLHDGTDQSGAPGFQPDLSHLHVDNDSPQTGTTGRIQEGIDLVTGSTVDIEAGTYDDTMNIEDKTGLTVNGVDKTTVIIQPSSTLDWDVGGYGSSRKAATRIVNSTDIVLQNMTMDFDLIKGNGIFGIFGWDSALTVDNTILKNMSVDDGSGGYYELASYFKAPGFTDEARADITFTGNTFIDAGRVGIVTHDYIYATIDGNTFYKTTHDFGYAVEVGSQSKGVVSNNVIYGYDTPAASDGSESAGIYIENAFTGTYIYPPEDPLPQITKNVTVENNEVYDCQYAMWIGNGYNTFAGNVDIVVSLLTNNFHDNLEGGLIIQDEDMADGSSVTVNGSGNTVVDNGDYGYRIFTQGDGDITVSLLSELITGHDIGMQVEEETGGGPSTSSYSVSINDSIISDNSTFGINNTVSSFIVDAKYNWWGHSKGPLDPYGTEETNGSTCYHPSTMVNADGLGNDVSDLYVDYCPWSLYQFPDRDADGIIDGLDNCLNVPNAPVLGTCMRVYYNVFRSTDETCLNDGDCAAEELCDLFQLDLNGVGNGIGDACECIADFGCDGDVDGEDTISFKNDFGRNKYNLPCTDVEPCNGDFNCDEDVDGDDAALFKLDFGRNQYYNPCPSCVVEPWCSYP